MATPVPNTVTDTPGMPHEYVRAWLGSSSQALAAPLRQGQGFLQKLEVAS